jgi:hypothetical protein
MDTMTAQIYGLTPTIMNELTILGCPLPITRKNYATIEAGDDANGMAVVFKGSIYTAWADFDNLPDTFLSINGASGVVEAMAPVPPISFPGTADVATILSGIAVRLGVPFDNAGVQVKLSNPYYAGTNFGQMIAVAKDANINLHYDEKGIHIWPKTGTLGGFAPLISPTSGLIGYPRYRDQGMTFRCVHNPSVVFGGRLTLQMNDDNFKAADGLWDVNGLALDLSTITDGGPWFDTVDCIRPIGTANRGIPRG